MFRRKEDSLFDNTTDLDQGDSMESTSHVSAPSSSSSSAQQANATPAYLNPQPAAPRAAEPRPSPAQPAQASSFRPAAPSAPLQSQPSTTSDLSRSRMPEPKQAAAPLPPASSAPSAFTMSNLGVSGSSKPGKRVLTVGNDILLKGEIATCDRLVIEGKVDATLNDVHTVEIAETGSFKGAAHIEDAEISGLFEGDLIVRNRLVIYATGKVRGKITYGEIEIERGGEIAGEIKTSNTGTQAAAPRAQRQTAPKDDKVAA